jgi:Copper transport outer membrane protein, MctB
MFDFRYHVASLAAVFLALVIGILVGVGISSGGFVSKSERNILNGQIDDLESQLDASRVKTGELSRTQRAATTYVEESYPLLMADRLASHRVALVFVGPVDQQIRDLVERTLVDAGAGTTLRIRAIRVPIDVDALGNMLDGRPALIRYARQDAARELGRRLAQELVRGGKAPVWRLLAPQLVEERAGNEERAADGVVVARSVHAQQGATARLLRGFYEGLANAGVPAVGVETSQETPTTIDGFDKANLATVDFIDTHIGRFALSLLLAGARPGSYGLKQTATDGVLPPVEPAAVSSSPAER